MHTLPLLMFSLTLDFASGQAGKRPRKMNVQVKMDVLKHLLVSDKRHDWQILTKHLSCLKLCVADKKNVIVEVIITWLVAGLFNANQRAFSIASSA